MRGRLEREIQEEARRESDRRSISRGRAGGSSDNKTRAPERETAESKSRGKDRRRSLWSRQRSFQLRHSELETMSEIGRFRMIDIEDLVQFRYQEKRTHAQQDLRNLIHQRLARQVRLVSPSGNRVRIVVLTGRGKRFLTRHPQMRGKLGKQKLYSGFVKPAEALHDASIYRMYQIEAQRIRRDGGSIRRVVLDYELKERVFRPLSKARGQSEEDLRDKQEELARRHGLKIIQGRVVFPDLRIEYETRDGERNRRDLELATEHYRPGQLAHKRQAGFKIYFAGSAGSSGSTVKEEREITADILSS